jgi:hypothetical protein
MGIKTWLIIYNNQIKESECDPNKLNYGVDLF